MKDLCQGIKICTWLVVICWQCGIVVIMCVLKIKRLGLYWTCLQKEEEKDILEIGAEALKNAALFHHPREEDLGEPRTGTEDRDNVVAVGDA